MVYLSLRKISLEPVMCFIFQPCLFGCEFSFHLFAVLLSFPYHGKCMCVRILELITSIIGGFVLDKEDRSITRSDLYFKELFRQCGLHLYKIKVRFEATFSINWSLGYIIVYWMNLVIIVTVFLLLSVKVTSSNVGFHFVQ